MFEKWRSEHEQLDGRAARIITVNYEMNPLILVTFHFKFGIESNSAFNIIFSGVPGCRMKQLHTLSEAKRFILR